MPFFEDYFIDPILFGTGYNPVNTAVYAIILIVAAVAVFKMLQKLRIAIDTRFLLGVMPFVVLGGALRAVEDIAELGGAARNVLLITPLIYFFVFGVALVALLVALGVQRVAKTAYYKTWFALGVIAVIATLAFAQVGNLPALQLIVGISAAWAVAIFAASRWRGAKRLLTKENAMVLWAHMFDATTTFTALQFPQFSEQHVVAGFFTGVFGPAAMFPLKLIVILLVLYLFDKEMQKPEEKEKRTFLKLLVLLLGLAPGIRNMLLVIA